MRALGILVATLTTLGAKAQGVSTPNAQPGWQVTAGKAAEDLGRPAASRLATFAAPGTGFDLGSYRSTVESRADYGLAYDAIGLFDAKEGGSYKFRVTASWDGIDTSTAARCAIKLRIEASELINWNGPINEEKGQQPLDGSVDLQPGAHDASFHVACDKPLGARFRVDLALRAPGDGDFRPPRPDEITHPAIGVSGMRVAEPVAPVVPPPSREVAPSPAPPREPPPREVGPERGQGQMLVATTDLRVRAEPRASARVIGRILAGQSVEVLGPADDPNWDRLAGGGYTVAAFLKPAGAAGPPRPTEGGEHVAGPSGKYRAGKYRVGDCTTYQTEADIGGGRHETVEGTACLQPDGRWRIVK